VKQPWRQRGAAVFLFALYELRGASLRGLNCSDEELGACTVAGLGSVAPCAGPLAKCYGVQGISLNLGRRTNKDLQISVMPPVKSTLLSM